MCRWVIDTCKSFRTFAGVTEAFKAEVVAALKVSDFSALIKTHFPKEIASAGDLRPTTHSRANALRGRMLAALGRKQEAEAAFEKAAEIAHRTGMLLYEMLALRDLIKCVLADDGRSEEGF